MYSQLNLSAMSRPIDQPHFILGRNRILNFESLMDEMLLFNVTHFGTNAQYSCENINYTSLMRATSPYGNSPLEQWCAEFGPDAKFVVTRVKDGKRKMYAPRSAAKVMKLIDKIVEKLDIEYEDIEYEDIEY
jgi:hypothetical protein